jgi:hypothetical protein
MLCRAKSRLERPCSTFACGARCTLRPVSGLSVYDGAGLYMLRHLLLALLQKIFTPNVLTSTRPAALAEFYCLGPIGDTVDYVR